MLDQPTTSQRSHVQRRPRLDLQEHLADLEAQGLLVRIDRAINKDTELHPLVHELEALPNYAKLLASSLQRQPTELATWMANRLLNSPLTRDARAAWLQCLVEVTTHPRASASGCPGSYFITGGAFDSSTLPTFTPAPPPGVFTLVSGFIYVMAGVHQLQAEGHAHATR